jgi:aspartate aminotransferase
VTAEPGQVIVTCGAKHAIEMAIRASVGPGDEVVIISPHWYAYPEQVRRTGATPVMVSALEQDGFVPGEPNIRAAITRATRMLVINSPCNPTGAVYPRERLEALASVALEHKLLILADEIHERVLFDGARHMSIASLDREVADRTITVNDISVTYAMPGWHVGYCVCPPAVLEGVRGLQQLGSSAPCTVAQHAAVAALLGDQTPVARYLEELTRRRLEVLRRTRAMPHVHAAAPLGSAYCFLNIEAIIGQKVAGKLVDGADAFARILRAVAGVDLVSGAAFGSNFHVRLSFAAADDVLDEGLRRMESLLASVEPVDQ